MFDYNPSTRILKIQQHPEEEMDLALVEFQKRSYAKFCEKTVFDIFADIEELLQGICDNTVILPQPNGRKFYTQASDDSAWSKELRAQPDRYTSVRCDISFNGSVHRGVEVFRLPYMDDDAILNIRGDRRICIMQMAVADGISYSQERKSFGISVPLRNITIAEDSKGFSVMYNKQKLNIADVVRMYVARELPGTDLRNLYVSAHILASLYDEADVAYEAVDASMAGRKVYETYHKPVYSLGGARDAINRAVAIDRAIGRYLSRPLAGVQGTVVYDVGTQVTEEVIRFAKKNFINEIYVKATPDVIGYRIATNATDAYASHDLYIFMLEAGTPVNDLIREHLPEELQSCYALPSSVVFNPEATETMKGDAYWTLAADPIVIGAGTVVSQDIAAILPYIGVDTLYVSRTADKYFPVTFEEEIIGNYTVRYSDVCGINVPYGRSADEWVCFYNNHEMQHVDDTYLNVFDWIALYSLCDSTRRNPDECMLLDKDTGMLKKVLGPNELFGQVLSDIIPSCFQICKQKWAAAAQSPQNLNIDMGIFFSKWRTEIWNQGIIAVANLQNPISHITQANHLVLNFPGSEIPDEVRLLAMGYYGRVCAYETPAGYKLGVTNTRAVGARIDDNGLLLTPYQRIVYDGKGYRISPRIEYMTAQQETEYAIGDRLSLKLNADGTIVNTKVIARVNDGHNGHTVETIDSCELDYVNAYSGQTLSPTASLVPFVGCDDSARISYASGMLKQSIMVQNNDKPRVYTSMYRRMFEHSNTYCAIAPEDGFIGEVTHTYIRLYCPPAEIKAKLGNKINLDSLYMDEDLLDSWPSHTFYVRPATVSRSSINFINYRVVEGQWVKKGDILFDSAIAKDGIYAPGCNLFAAYIPDGYNYEDAIEVSESAANKLTSISVETVKLKLPSYQGAPIMQFPEGRYISENSVMATFKLNRRGYQDKRIMNSGIHSGILLGVEKNHKNQSGTEYLGHLVAFNRLRTGDKLIGRHANKGTASIIQKNSKMPRFLNGRPLDIVLNPCGVPSRLNIGQNYEAYLGFIATLLDVYIESDSFNGASRSDISLLMHYVYDLANCESVASVNSKYEMLPAGLRQRALEREEDLKLWAGCFNPDGTAYLYNPNSGKLYETPITFGVPYFLKLEHEVNHKIHARAGELEEEYSRVYKQPPEGASRGGGQRMGEMEMCAYAAYGANDLLWETLNSSSDNVIERLRATLTDLGLQDRMEIRDKSYLFDEGAAVPHAVEMFVYLLEALGIGMSSNDDSYHLPDPAWTSAQMRVIPDKRGILSAAHKPADKTTVGEFFRGKYGG